VDVLSEDVYTNVFNFYYDKMQYIIKQLIEFREQIKLYHWRTTSYARHKATDEFIENFDPKVDEFVEVLMGGRNEKNTDDFSVSFITLREEAAESHIIGFRDWVNYTLPRHIHNHETDLLNLKDEILALVNRLLYLFRLN
jgi:hypothetical protein